MTSGQSFPSRRSTTFSVSCSASLRRIGLGDGIDESPRDLYAELEFGLSARSERPGLSLVDEAPARHGEHSYAAQRRRDLPREFGTRLRQRVDALLCRVADVVARDFDCSGLAKACDGFFGGVRGQEMRHVDLGDRVVGEVDGGRFGDACVVDSDRAPGLRSDEELGSKPDNCSRFCHWFVLLLLFAGSWLRCPG